MCKLLWVISQDYHRNQAWFQSLGTTPGKSLSLSFETLIVFEIWEGHPTGDKVGDQLSLPRAALTCPPACCTASWFCRTQWFECTETKALHAVHQGSPRGTCDPSWLRECCCLIVDETNLPADIPSYLSSQGTLADRQDGYVSSESGSHHQFVTSSGGGFFLPQHDSNGKCLRWTSLLWALREGRFEITWWKIHI